MSIICTGFGQYDTRKEVSQPYGTTDVATVWSSVANPVSIDKAQAPWIIPSSYHASDAREFETQTNKGSFDSFLCWDVDVGNHEKSAIITMAQSILGEGTAFAVYSTASSRLDRRKWRVLIPISDALTAMEYSGFQVAALEEAYDHGIELDRALVRPAQLVYLPNRGEFYDHEYVGQYQMAPRTHRLNARAQEIAQHLAEAKQATGKLAERDETERSILRAFREKHPTSEMLRLYGFETKNGIHWKNPFSGSGSYGGLILYEDRDAWFSNAEGMTTREIGKSTYGGAGRYGDGFDLYVYFNCNGNVEQARHYAKKCLIEKEDAKYGDATSEHGREVFDKFIRQAQEQSVQRIDNAIQATDGEGNNDEWDLDWPPGALGEVAKYLYFSSSRPIKQFAIAGALYLFSVGGKKYNVFGKGLNLYIMLVANTGRGKGVVKDGIDGLLNQLVTYAQNPNLQSPFAHEVPISEPGIRSALGMQNPLCVYEEELGSTLLPTTKPNCGSTELGIRKLITRLFDSGQNKKLGIKQGSTAERTKASVDQPTFTMAGDTQPGVFNALLGSGMEDTGFPSRMLPFFYYGERLYHNKESNQRKEVPAPILQHLKLFMEYTLNTNAVLDIPWSTEAEEASDALDRSTTDRINKGEPGVEFLNRAHMLTARVAGIIAVGVNHLNPIIDMEAFEYARNLVVGYGLERVQKILASGGTGSGDNVRLFHIREEVKKFKLVGPDTKIRTYKTPKAIVDNPGVINDSFFMIKLRTNSDFAGTPGGKTTEDNIRKALEEAVQQDILEVHEPLMVNKNTKQKFYVAGSSF